MQKALLISCAILGSVIGSITLSLLIATFYPSVDPLNRLYAAVFLPVLFLCGMLCFSLLSVNGKQVFWRAWSWWPLLLILLEFTL